MAKPPPTAPPEPTPLALSEDESGAHFLIYRTPNGAEAELRVDGDTFWASQGDMAAIFGVTQQTISEHLRNVFAEGELADDEATHRKILSVRQEGPREVRRNIDHYNLNVLISVGYRVSGPLGTAFRIWATDKLFSYLTKGFVIDGERLKNPDGRPDHFEELLDAVRDIRASEKRMWTRVLELAAFCADYAADDQTQHNAFFSEIQNTMHWAVMQMTAPELILDRVSADKPNAGVVTFRGKQPTVTEARTAKNVLQEPEITALNHITSLTLEFFESQAEQRRLTTLADFLSKLRELVRLDGRPLKQPGYVGQVSRSQADDWAAEQLKTYKTQARIAAEARGEGDLKKIADAVKAAKATRKRKPK